LRLWLRWPARRSFVGAPLVEDVKRSLDLRAAAERAGKIPCMFLAGSNQAKTGGVQAPKSTPVAASLISSTSSSPTPPSAPRASAPSVRCGLPRFFRVPPGGLRRRRSLC
jgi:hypothetical protein